VNYSELLQLAKGWGNFIFDRIIIWRLPMICALNYLNNEQLPESKMELYERCCEMLMDARDNQRKIDGNIYENLPQLHYGKKRKILEEISFWRMNGNVSSESKGNVIEYLKHSRQRCARERL
jgi:hypothetical protein